MKNYDNPHPSVMPVARRPDVCFVRGKGSWLWDSYDKPYLDFVQGWAVNCLGHAPDIVAEALARQAAELIHPGPGYFNAPMIELADMIAAHSCFDQLFFTNSGAEANEGAIKLARKWGAIYKQGAFEIITLQHGFHGRTLATMCASGKSGWEELYAPKMPGFIKVARHDIDAVEAAIGRNTVAIMLEPVQGESGVHPMPEDYLRALRRLADEHGVLLIFDEVQTGMGRTGTLFAYEHSGVEPDIMTLGKGLGGGVPLAGLAIKKEVSCFEPGDQGGTFNGNPLMSAVGLAVVNALLAPGFLHHVRVMGRRLSNGLTQISGKYGLGEVRGEGLLLAMDTGSLPAAALVEHMLAAGVLINAPREHTLRFMPALNVAADEIDRMLALLNAACADLKTTLAAEEVRDASLS